MRLLRAALPHVWLSRTVTASTLGRFSGTASERIDATAAATTSAIRSHGSHHSTIKDCEATRNSQVYARQHDPSHESSTCRVTPIFRFNYGETLHNVERADENGSHDIIHGHAHVHSDAHAHASPWPCGTWDDPVPITSVTSSRVVACCGKLDADRPHPTVWVTVTEAHPAQCPTCHQVFKLIHRQQ